MSKFHRVPCNIALGHGRKKGDRKLLFPKARDFREERRSQTMAHKLEGNSVAELYRADLQCLLPRVNR